MIYVLRFCSEGWLLEYRHQLRGQGAYSFKVSS